MSFKYYAITVVLAMQIQAAPCCANEAQASLTGGQVQLRYNIPVHLSAEEKEWYKVFQEGNMLIDGWQKISANLLLQKELFEFYGAFLHVSRLNPGMAPDASQRSG